MAIKLSVELPRRRNAPHLSRRALEVFADEFEPERFYDARLLVTEIVASAISAGGTSPVRLEATLDGTLFHAEIIDLGNGFVGETRGVAALEDAGWDLHLVAELSDRWGTHERQGVWFELDVTRDAPGVSDFLRPRGASS